MPIGSSVSFRAISPPSTSRNSSINGCPTRSACIAHYNRGGFWDTFFTSTADKVRFLRITVQYPCYGDPAWTFSDVEQAVQAWLKAEGTLEQYQQRLADETEDGERAVLARLQKKYGQTVQSS